ncbi:MAG: hypothetical protein IKS44_07880, partial [Bacteroidales bacterium]|nr:hypothetical protein [Bacteroidales bacterium]
MNKKSTIGLILIFAIFVGYMWWISIPTEEEKAERDRQDSIARIEYARLAEEAARADSLATEQHRLDSLAAAGDT